jgi:hypothetical protein
MTILPIPTDHACLVELFATPKRRYSVADALRLTHTTPRELDTLIAEGRVSPQGDSGARTLPWEDVSMLALQQWTPRMIEASLRRTGSLTAIPLLNRLQRISLYLPVYQIRLLHLHAEAGRYRAPLNASDVLERQLLDLASAMKPREVERWIPGFRRALQYPSLPQSPNVNDTDACCYCGARAFRRRTCVACRTRHEEASVFGHQEATNTPDDAPAEER